jgi:predicted secreted protein
MKILVFLVMFLVSFTTAFADQPTTVLNVVQKNSRLTMNIPYIDGANNESLQGLANKVLRQETEALAKKINNQGTVSYEVRLNRPSLVSVLLKATGAGSAPLYKAVNIDLTTGRAFGLSDFLQEGMAIREILPANYQDVLFDNDGVYTNKGALQSYNDFTPYGKLVGLMRISDAGRIMPVWKLTRECEDKELTVKAGSLLALKLTSNPSTGYRWASNITNGGQGKLYQTGSSFTLPLNAPKGATGVPGNEILVFAAQAPGEYTVHMSYSRAWEKNKGYNRFSFKVKVI